MENFRMVSHATTAAAVALMVMVTGCGKTTGPGGAVPIESVAVGNESDRDVTERVKVAMSQSEELRGSNIAVTTNMGDVTLTGVLDTRVQVDSALKIAQGAQGVRTVRDELTLRK